jgi:dTDP-4-amino-4,6-dideoxygalactose transaminase
VLTALDSPPIIFSVATEQTTQRAGVGVPFLDLSHVHEGLKASLLADVSDLIDTNAYVNGPPVAEFEEAFAAYCGVDHCVGVASGLDALRLALIALGLEDGAEVLVPANTFIATFEAVTQAGGIPRPVDISEDDGNIDPALAEAAVSNRTKVILPVHLYGQMADMRALSRLAEDYGLQLLEDACQAHGAMRDGLRAGAEGFAGCFSFYPGKNLGAMGDAGALVTRDGELAERIRALREHGQRRKYEHDFEGYTARLDSIQALVLLRKLPLLDGWNDARRRAAAFYAEALSGVGDLRLPRVPVGSEPVWHLYVVRTDDPGALAAHLAQDGIGTGRHYPQPAHLSPAYRYLGYGPGDFPRTEVLAATALSLPLFPGISNEQLDRVVGAVREFFRG